MQWKTEPAGLFITRDRLAGSQQMLHFRRARAVGTRNELIGLMDLPGLEVEYLGYSR